MMKFTEIMEAIKKLNMEISNNEETMNEEIERYYDNLKSMKLAERVEYKKTHKAEEAEHMEIITKYDTFIKNGKMKVKLMKHNAKIALYAEVMPIALEILSKYNGKPYGEKTKEKISNEMKEKANCYMYINSRYSWETLEISPLNCHGTEFNLSTGTIVQNGERKPLLIDNKIQAVTMEEMQLFYTKDIYFEDLEATIEEMKRIEAEYEAKKQELKAIEEKYDCFRVDGFERLSK